MRILILLLISITTFGQLPESGSLSLKGAAGVGRSISQQVDGNETGNKSLTTLSETAGFSIPHRVSDFYGYGSAPDAPTGPMTNRSINPGGMEVGWDPPSGGGMYTNFRLEWRWRETDEDPFDSYSFYEDTGVNNTPLIPHADLTTGWYYQWRVRAENSFGNSAYLESAETQY